MEEKQKSKERVEAEIGYEFEDRRRQTAKVVKQKAAGRREIEAGE